MGKRKGLPMIKVVESESPEVEGPCWIWQGLTCSGYGVITYPTARFPGMTIGRRKDHRKGWRVAATHQLFYFMKFGNPPKGTELGHTCNRRSCCSPLHVRPITAIQNAAEMYRMPALAPEEYELVEELLLQDMPTRQISDRLCISVWSIRQIAKKMGQLVLDFSDTEVPF